MMWLATTLLLACAACVSASSHNSLGKYSTLPSLREQAELQDAWTAARIEGIPALLRKYNVDAWLMSQKEYAEDTVFWSLKSATQFSARRRTVDLFLADNKTGPASYNWIDNTPTVWDELRAVLTSESVSIVAVNINTDIAFASGLHAGEYAKFVEELGDFVDFVDVPMLAVEFVGTMPEGQFGWYKKMMGTAWAMIEEAFSEKVIVPGVTSTADVEWWLRSKIQQENYTTWFQTDIEVVKSGKSTPEPQPGDYIIQHGDLLHCDFGVTAMGMNTDTQHLAYVLYPGETEVDIPHGLKEGLKKVNRLQDIVRAKMIPGQTGNEVLAASLAKMREEDIEGRVYCHSIGDWGHSAGTVIGMTNLQSGVPVLGDLSLLPDTYYSVELYAEHFVPEWNATFNFYQEEDVFWNGSTRSWEWVWGRQELLHLIKTPSTDDIGAKGEHIQFVELR